MSADVLVGVSSIAKSFAGFAALDDVSLEIQRGEVLGLVGENGAGKSTLLNILCGVLRADSGELSLRGEHYAPTTYRQAMDRGVFRVYQEPALISTLSVRDNLVLGLEDKFAIAGFLRQSKIRDATDEILEVVRDFVDPDRITASYGVHVRQIIEILRATFAAEVLSIEDPLILLDEPTAALSAAEIAILFESIERIRGRASFVFVSHRLLEIHDICDRAYVLKDGRVVAEVPSATGDGELHSLMVGRERAADYYRQSLQSVASNDVVLQVDGLAAPSFRNVSFEVHRGEILGVFGVIASGKTEVGRVLAGIDRRDRGTVTIAGQTQSRDTPWSRRSAGLAYIPADRAQEGIISTFTVRWNVSLPSLGDEEIALGPFVQASHETAVCRRWIDRLRIRPQSPESYAQSLSGGNQQKVVIAKWLQAGVVVLVLDNPTRGVDAGAKFEIYTLLRSVVNEGIGLVLISDDLPELIGLSNRILIMKDGEVSVEVGAPAERKPNEVAVIGASV